jgi:hypothetical protein
MDECKPLQAGGTVLAFPQSGTAMNTEFGIVAESWEDADPPLSYRYTVHVKGEQGQPAGAYTRSPSAQFELSLCPT